MKALIKYLTKREKLIARLMATPRYAYTNLTFHKLRVELKKLNALFEILEYCSTEFKHRKYFKPFKTLFQQAGKVRELHITEALLKTHFDETSLIQFSQYIAMQKKNEEDAFFSLTTKSKRSKLKKQFQLIEPFALQTTKKMIRRYLEKNRNRIKKEMTQENIQMDQVHALRKQIKTYNYNRRIIEKNDLNRNITSTDHLSDLVGQWHDLQITLDYIQASKKSIAFEPEESNLLLEGTRKMSAESDQLFKDILSAVPSSEFNKGK